MRYQAPRFLVLVAATVLPVWATADESSALYATKIRRLLADKCLACHGPDVQESDLRLDDRGSAIRKLDSGHAAIIPGNPDESELIRRLTTDDPDERMPPEGEPLSREQIATLESWIAQSAPFTKHWAYTDLDAKSPPDVKEQSWITNSIDRFILARLESEGISPSPAADRFTLIKRLHYDLVGLPPPRDVVQRFVRDNDADAYERAVDSLLNSKHFGERWGRHWLDKARYADSDGYEKDRPRPNAWRYRDWVIQAVNDDMPMDQFTIEQLAGDLLPSATDEQRLATAFHRQTLTNTEGGVDKEEFRVDAVFDRTETTGTVWLGLTIGCARCHTHKYDTISQDEYYRMFAFFNNGDETDLSIPKSRDELERYERKKAEYDQQLKQLSDQIDARRLDAKPSLQRWLADLEESLERANASKLHPLEIQSASASVKGHEFSQLDDGSVFVGGVNPDSAVDYEIITTVNITEPITGIRLDALTHDSLPKKGPGRVAHGNFVLSELEVYVGEEKLELTDGRATFAQNKFPARNAIDGKLDTGWAISPELGKDHHLRFRLQQKRALPSNQTVTIRLRQHYGSEHALGRFRIRWVTGTDLNEIATEPIRKLARIPRDKRTANHTKQLEDHFLREEFAPTKSLYQQIDSLKKKVPAEPIMKVRVISQRSDRRQTRVLDRGDFLSPTHVVGEGGLGVLPKLKGRREEAVDRLDFANWLFDPANPLPPRVLANHVWAHLFGEGLVRTQNDFGVRGQPPTHPRLLDWLGQEYRRLGWSRKRLIKTIVMSSTYRQASRHRLDLLEVDPQNLRLARQNRFRVPAEIVRDLCLSVSGLLSEKVGGPSVFPPLPADVASLSYANNFKWQTSKGDDRYRRGMYTFFKRTAPHPNLVAFDCPDSNTTSVARRISNTPLQALTILNNEVYVEAAQALAARVLAEDASDQRRVEELLQRCVVRDPTEFETNRFVALLEQSRSYYKTHMEDAKKLAARHQDAAIDPIEAAAWFSVSRIALNLDEFITRE